MRLADPFSLFQRLLGGDVPRFPVSATAAHDPASGFSNELRQHGFQARNIDGAFQGDGPPAPVAGRVLQKIGVVRGTDEADRSGEVFGIAPELLPKMILLGGGVVSNIELRNLTRSVAKEYGLPTYIPYNKKLITDNAGMIGVVASYQFARGEFSALSSLDRLPNLNF